MMSGRTAPQEPVKITVEWKCRKWQEGSGTLYFSLLKRKFIKPYIRTHAWGEGSTLHYTLFPGKYIKFSFTKTAHNDYSYTVSHIMLDRNGKEHVLAEKKVSYEEKFGENGLLYKPILQEFFNAVVIGKGPAIYYGRVFKEEEVRWLLEWIYSKEKREEKKKEEEKETPEERKKRRTMARLLAFASPQTLQYVGELLSEKKTEISPDNEEIKQEKAEKEKTQKERGKGGEVQPQIIIGEDVKELQRKIDELGRQIKELEEEEDRIHKRIVRLQSDLKELQKPKKKEVHKGCGGELYVADVMHLADGMVMYYKVCRLCGKRGLFQKSGVTSVLPRGGEEGWDPFVGPSEVEVSLSKDFETEIVELPADQEEIEKTKATVNSLMKESKELFERRFQLEKERDRIYLEIAEKLGIRIIREEDNSLVFSDGTKLYKGDYDTQMYLYDTSQLFKELPNAYEIYMEVAKKYMKEHGEW